MKVYQQLTNGVRIMEYEAMYAQAVADMWNASGDSWGGDLSVRTGEDIQMDLNSGAYLNIYIAEKEGEVLGFASLSKYFADGNALYLHVLNVRPDKHGQKLGKALVLQCVYRTIELGYPRLDIHTWPGNTKSVPLYKKCGYMWEDRVDSTHLVNFIPTVLNTEICKPFFETADWYADNKRVLQLKPDGEKMNQFEVFRYIWEKDGHRLAVGFERTGRRMRLLETDDYRVELTAENHELAFGLDYNCAFEVENKTGQPLHIHIQGKNESNLRFTYALDTDVEGCQRFEAKFFVGEITEPQDIWRVHPCVLADIYINGKHAEFGMGIETKWPVNLTLEEMKKISVPGASYDGYFNLTSYLRQDAEITIRLPETEAKVTRFDLSAGSQASAPQAKSNPTAQHERTLPIPALGKACVKALATAVSLGHEAVPVVYDIKLSDGYTFSFTRTLHVNSRGLTGACAYETETDCILQNGPWMLGLNKKGAYAWTNHVSQASNGPGFPLGELGRPYSDEFTRMNPETVRMYPQGDTMVLEVSYPSHTYAGITYTGVYTLAAAGVFTRRHRLENNSSGPVSLFLKDESHPILRKHTVLPYNGTIQTIRDSLTGCAENLEKALIDENWAYDDDPRFPNGFCWPPQYQLNVRWGDCFFFEHECSLQPGESFETEPVMAVCGQFYSFNDFRDFARQSYTPIAPLTVPHIDWTVNGGNPFAETDTWTASLQQYRSERLEGEISVTAGAEPFTGLPKETGCQQFNQKPCLASAKGKVTPVTLRMNLKTFDKSWQSAIFTPNPESPVETIAQDGLFTANNGVITFSADPSFSDACFSLTKDGHEWLMSQYPSRAPYAWFNPFIGGLNGELEHMRDAMIIRESITAEFTEETDVLGNKWKGLATTVNVEKFDEHKGIDYTQYYLTLPGLPVLCYFVRVHNKTGLFKRTGFHIDAFMGHPGDMKKLIVSGKDAKGVEYRYHVGSDSCWRDVDRLVMVEMDEKIINGKPAADKLYLYRDTTSAEGLSFDFDLNIFTVSTNFRTITEPGAIFTAKPLFMILTPETLTSEMLGCLDKVSFK